MGQQLSKFVLQLCIISMARSLAQEKNRALYEAYVQWYFYVKIHTTFLKGRLSARQIIRYWKLHICSGTLENEEEKQESWNGCNWSACREVWPCCQPWCFLSRYMEIVLEDILKEHNWTMHNYDDIMEKVGTYSNIEIFFLDPALALICIYRYM